MAAVAVTTGTTFPLFLTGAMGVHLQEELGFGQTGLGIAVAAFTAAVAAGAWALGGVADRLGGRVSMRVGVVFTGLAALGIGGASASLPTLALLLAAAGLGNALSQPAAGALLVSEIPGIRQGIAFGIFQSAKPIAVLLSGLAVPLIALTVGWRWAFVGAGLFAITTALVVPAVHRVPVRARSQETPRTRLPAKAIWLMTVGSGFGFGAAHMLATFLVDSAVRTGIDPGSAGLLLSVGAALAITTRITFGYLADRTPVAPIRTVSTMLLIGGGCTVLIAVGDRPWALVIGAMLISITLWGMNGLFFLSLGRLHSSAPGTIAGIGLSAGSFGGIVGPVSFGAIAENVSVAAAWMVCASWAIVAGIAMRLSIRYIPPSDAAPARFRSWAMRSAFSTDSSS